MKNCIILIISSIALLIPNNRFVLLADNTLHQFSVRNKVLLEVYGTKAYPHVLIKSGSTKKKIYFSCDKHKICLSLNETKDSSLFIENGDILRGDIIIKNYKFNKKQKFINLQLNDSIGKVRIVENNNRLFFQRSNSMSMIHSNEDIHVNKKELPLDNIDYKPSITISLNINQTNSDNEEIIKQSISKEIESSFYKQFSNYQQICEKYLKNQFTNSKDKMKAISILESYYDKLVKNEEEKRKEFKTNYTLINKSLSEKLTLINNQINELEGTIEEIRKISDQIRTANREKQTLKEKVQTSKNAIISEKQMLKGDLESQSTYGIFAVSIVTKGRSFDEIDKTLQNIFEHISLKTLSEVFISSETEMRDGLLVSDTITSKLSGILSMTGSKDVYRGFDSNNKTLAVKMIKYTPFWERRKGGSSNKIKETYSNWYITQHAMSDFRSSIKAFFTEKQLKDIIDNVSSMLQDCNTKNLICKRDRSDFIKQVAHNIIKFQRSINENEMKISKIDKKITSFKQSKPILSTKFNKIKKQIKDSIKKFNKVDNDLSKIIREGYKFSIYEFSYKPSSRKQNALETFTELAIDMFEKVFLKSRVIHKTMETTISKGMFTKENNDEVLLQKNFNHVCCYFDVPMASDYPYPHYAILKVEIQVYEPSFKTHSSIISKLETEIFKKERFFTNEMSGSGQKKNYNPKIIDIFEHEQEKPQNFQIEHIDPNNNKIINPRVSNKKKYINKKHLFFFENLVFSLQCLDYRLPIYETISKPGNTPSQLAKTYNIYNIKSWRIPTIKELEKLYHRSPTGIKSSIEGKKIYTSGKMKNNKFEYVIFENNEYHIGYSSRNEFVNLIFVTQSIY